MKFVKETSFYATGSSDAVPIIIILIIICWLISISKKKKPKGKWLFVPDKKKGCVVTLIPAILAPVIIWAVSRL
jgi:hypothetical protein